MYREEQRHAAGLVGLPGAAGGMVQRAGHEQLPTQGGGRRTGCWHAACMTSACAEPREAGIMLSCWWWSLAQHGDPQSDTCAATLPNQAAAPRRQAHPPHTFRRTHSTSASAGRLCKRRCRGAGSAGQRVGVGEGREGRRGRRRVQRALSGGMVGSCWVMGAGQGGQAVQVGIASGHCSTVGTAGMARRAWAACTACNCTTSLHGFICPPWYPKQPAFVGRLPPAAQHPSGPGCAALPAPCCRGWRTGARWLPPLPLHRLRCRWHHPRRGRM